MRLNWFWLLGLMFLLAGCEIVTRVDTSRMDAGMDETGGDDAGE